MIAAAHIADPLTELLALRARLDDIIATLRAAPPAQPAKPPPTYMKLGEFCARWDISRSTFYKYAAEGLPAHGECHGRRVKVADGDAWMERRTGRKAVAHV